MGKRSEKLFMRTQLERYDESCEEVQSVLFEIDEGI